MSSKRTIRQYRHRYSTLLGLYPAKYQQQFRQSMEQTFEDLLTEQTAKNKSLFACAIWAFSETFTGIMREHLTSLTKQPMRKKLAIWAFSAAFVLLIPLTAMQFTDEVTWSTLDFIFAGALLLGAGISYEIIARRTSSISYRTAAGTALLAALLLIWVNGAVGIIGSEDNPANLLYGGVLLVGIAGSLIAGFRSHGMTRALLATAVAQLLVPVAALLYSHTSWGAANAQGVFTLNMLFVMLFALSAILFWQSGSRKKIASQA